MLCGKSLVKESCFTNLFFISQILAHFYNLIFYMFIRFPAILLVKQLIYISMNFVHGAFYIAIFSNKAQRQRARYRVARYVIINNVTTATLKSKTKNA